LSILFAAFALMGFARDQKEVKLPPPTPRRRPIILVCHNKIELPFSCEQCHGTNAKLRPADHPPEYLESHSRPNAKFDKTTCAVCHGRRFRCSGCL
jgi:hypothetical protein